VIKYEDRLVESGDPLRSMSICLFRRIFGESQEPRDGFVLDSVGSTPPRTTREDYDRFGTRYMVEVLGIRQ